LCILQTPIYKFESNLDDGIVLILSEWATKIEYLAPGLQQTPEWLALLDVSEMPYAGGHYGHDGQRFALPDLLEASNLLEITVKDVTDFDTFDLTQENYGEAYLDQNALIQTDFENAVIPVRGFRMNINGYENLESIVSVGVAILADPEAAQIHRDDFDLVVKTVVSQYL